MLGSGERYVLKYKGEVEGWCEGTPVRKEIERGVIVLELRRFSFKIISFVLLVSIKLKSAFTNTIKPSLRLSS